MLPRRVPAAPDAAFPATAEASWPPAIVLGAYQTGVVAVRGLRRRGVRAFLVDCDSRQPGFRSTHGPAVLCPDPQQAPEEWLAAMQDLSQRVGSRPVLLASSDQFVTAIARAAPALRAHFRLTAGAELQGALADKDTQYALAAQHGMPMPRSVRAATIAEVQSFGHTAAFPCVLKPLHFREWQRFPAGHPLAFQKLVIAHDAEELAEAYALASEINATVMLQEIVQGPDTGKRVYLAHYDEHGTRTGHALFRALRCDPIGFGPATVTEPVIDEEAAEVCDAFLRRLGYRGICEIEVKRDVRDGGVKLIEANPRLSGGGDAGPYDGVDLAWLHYLSQLEIQHAPVLPQRRDFRHVVVRSDAVAVVRYLRYGLVGWRDVLHSYRPPLRFFDLDWRDRLRSLRNLASAARSVLREMFARRDPAHSQAAADAGILPRTARHVMPRARQASR